MATPMKVDGRHAFAQAADQTWSAVETQVERDYLRACAWLGWMPFNEFAAGYRAMEDWYRERPFSAVSEDAAVA